MASNVSSAIATANRIARLIRNPRHSLPVIAIAIVIVLLQQQWGVVPQSVQKTEPTPTVVAPTTREASHGGELRTVVSVVDGDTIKIEGGEVVRYIGMNTPETVAPGRPVECYGKEASAKNKELVLGKVVELVKDVSDRDRYGRLLRYVWVGDTMINEVMVREGYAQVSTFPPDVANEQLFLAAQRKAMDERKGLWGDVCPKPTPTLLVLPTVATGSGVPTEIYPTP